MSVVSVAFAQVPDVSASGADTASDIFTPVDTGLAMRWLRNVLGGAIDGNASPTALSQMIRVFNAGIMALGSFLLTYNLLAGIAQTAHEGTVLGRRWSSLWAPLRVTFGMIMLAPLPSGFCGAQVATVWVATQGVGLADNVWKAGVTAVATAGGNSIAQPVIPSAETVVGQLLNAQVCMRAVNALAAASGQGPWIAINTSSNKGRIRTSFDGANGSGLPAAACGAISISQGAEGSPLLEAHKQQLSAATAALWPIADAIVVASKPNGTGKYPATGTLTPILQRYSAALTTAATALVQKKFGEGQEKFVEEANAGGWAAAGAWYMTIARINGEIQTQANALPQIEGIRVDAFQAQTLANDLPPMILAANNWFETASYDGRPSAIAATLTYAKSDGAGDILRKVLDAGQWTWQYDLVKLDPKNPIASMIHVGDWLSGLAGSILAAAALAFGAAEGGSHIPFWGAVPGFFKGMIQTVLPYLQLVVIALYGAGSTLSHVIPLLPFIMWMAVVMSWLIFVVEASIAGAIWAAAHLRADGEGIAGEGGRPGYMLVFNLFLRPSLAILGLGASYAIQSVGIDLLNIFYVPVVKSITVNSWSGLSGFVVFTVVFCSQAVNVVQKSLALMHMIPDRLARWFGAGGEHLGEDHDAQSTRNAAGQVAGHRTESVLTGGMAAMGRGQPAPSAPPRGGEGKQTTIPPDVGKMGF